MKLRTVQLQVAVTGLTILMLFGILAACAVKRGPTQEEIARPPKKQLTREQFTADFVTDEWKPNQLPQGGLYFRQQSIISAESTLTSYFTAGDYILQTKPASRKPIKVTLHGVPGSLAWSIDDSSVATLSAAGRQATLNFKNDGRAKIVVKSGDAVVFRLRLIATTGKDKDKKDQSVWQVVIDRENEDGKSINMYGDVTK